MTERVALAMFCVVFFAGLEWIQNRWDERQLRRLDEDNWKGRKALLDRAWQIKTFRRLLLAVSLLILLLP